MSNDTLIMIAVAGAIWYFGFGPGKVRANPQAVSPTIVQRDATQAQLGRQSIFPKPGEIVQYTSGSKVVYTGEGGVA